MSAEKSDKEAVTEEDPKPRSKLKDFLIIAGSTATVLGLAVVAVAIPIAAGVGVAGVIGIGIASNMLGWGVGNFLYGKVESAWKSLFSKKSPDKSKEPQVEREVSTEKKVSTEKMRAVLAKEKGTTVSSLKKLKVVRHTKRPHIKLSHKKSRHRGGGREGGGGM
jgi:hypothetical protein